MIFSVKSIYSVEKVTFQVGKEFPKEGRRWNFHVNTLCWTFPSFSNIFIVPNLYCYVSSNLIPWLTLNLEISTPTLDPTLIFRRYPAISTLKFDFQISSTLRTISWNKHSTREISKIIKNEQLRLTISRKWKRAHLTQRSTALKNRRGNDVVEGDESISWVRLKHAVICLTHLYHLVHSSKVICILRVRVSSKQHRTHSNCHIENHHLACLESIAWGWVGWGCSSESEMKTIIILIFIHTTWSESFVILFVSIERMRQIYV